MLLGSDEQIGLMLVGIALLLGFLVDSSVCLAFVLSLVLGGFESLWLELAFARLISSGLVFAFVWLLGT